MCGSPTVTFDVFLFQLNFNQISDATSVFDISSGIFHPPNMEKMPSFLLSTAHDIVFVDLNKLQCILSFC